MSKKDRKFKAYRKARAVLRRCVPVTAGDPNEDRQVDLVVDNPGAQPDWVGAISIRDLSRVANHRCPPGGDDRFQQGRAVGLREALEEVAAKVGELIDLGPIAEQKTTDPQALALAIAARFDVREFRSIRSVLRNVLSTGNGSSDRIPAERLGGATLPSLVDSARAQVRELASVGEQVGIVKLTRRLAGQPAATMVGRADGPGPALDVAAEQVRKEFMSVWSGAGAGPWTAPAQMIPCLGCLDGHHARHVGGDGCTCTGECDIGRAQLDRILAPEQEPRT